MEGVFGAVLFHESAFEIEGLLRSEKARPGDDFGTRETTGQVEHALFGLYVVLGVIAIEQFVLIVIAVADVAAGGEDFAVLVVLDLVGLQGGGVHLRHGIALEAGYALFRLLGYGTENVLAFRWRVGPGDASTFSVP